MHNAMNGRRIHILRSAQLGKWIWAIKFKGKGHTICPSHNPQDNVPGKNWKGLETQMFLLFLQSCCSHHSLDFLEPVPLSTCGRGKSLTSLRVENVGMQLQWVKPKDDVLASSSPCVGVRVSQKPVNSEGCGKLLGLPIFTNENRKRSICRSCSWSCAAEGCYWGRGWVQMSPWGRGLQSAGGLWPHCQRLGAPSAAGPNGFTGSLALQLQWPNITLRSVSSGTHSGVTNSQWVHLARLPN